MLHEETLSRKKEVGIHLGFWLLLGYFNLIRFDEGYYLKLRAFELFFITAAIIFIATFYFNYIVVLPRVFRVFKWRKVFVGLIFSYLFFIILRFFIEQYLTVVLFDTQNYFAGFSLLYYMYDNLYFASQPIIISTIFWLVVFLIRLLAYNKFIIEEQKNTEIKFLKAQINPHFIFNTLNNIYSMVYFQSPKSLPAIEKLSQIMRFTTYESQKEKIKLTEEINYIKAYVQLEILRHEEEDFVKLEIDLQANDIEIPPYILSPLVENALKHGIASNTTPIIITLEANGDSLRFTVQNGISNQKKDKLGGIGLTNLKRRLEIHYPQKHTLDLMNENNIFIAILEIQLR